VKETNMSDTEWDVVLAAYMIQDQAEEDFDRLVKLVQHKELQVEGVVVVTKDAAGEISVRETGDHLGRKGLEIGGGVGLVIGLLCPPLLASVVVGGAAGGLIAKFAKHRVEKGLEEKMDQALAPGWAAVVAIYDRSKADTVDASLVSAVKKSVAHVDGHGAKQLKAALEEAAQGKGS
jgi:arylsulfatase